MLDQRLNLGRQQEILSTDVGLQGYIHTPGITNPAVHHLTGLGRCLPYLRLMQMVDM